MLIAGSSQTTALGAAIGAVAGWGTGAAIGAGAGAAAGLAGVLLTRGAPAVVFPETPLTFRIQQAVNVNTERAPQAFQPMNPYDYQQQPVLQASCTVPLLRRSIPLCVSLPLCLRLSVSVLGSRFWRGDRSWVLRRPLLLSRWVLGLPEVRPVPIDAILEGCCASCAYLS
jgi:hypothetical protein